MTDRRRSITQLASSLDELDLNHDQYAKFVVSEAVRELRAYATELRSQLLQAAAEAFEMGHTEEAEELAAEAAREAP